MLRFRTADFGPIDWVGAAFSTPLVSLAVAVVVAGGLAVFTSTHNTRKCPRGVHRDISAASLPPGASQPTGLR